MKNMYEFDSLFGAVAVEAAGQAIVSAAATRNNSMKRRLICDLLCSPDPVDLPALWDGVQGSLSFVPLLKTN
jgi:hypothetical protein